jgi:hypothetical protein
MSERRGMFLGHDLTSKIMVSVTRSGGFGRERNFCVHLRWEFINSNNWGGVPNEMKPQDFHPVEK